MSVDDSEHPAEPTLPMIEAGAARPFARLISWIWWSGALLIAIQVVQTALSLLDSVPSLLFRLLSFTLAQNFRFATLMGFGGMPLAIIFYYSIWRYARRERKHAGALQSRKLNASIIIFQVTSLLLMGNAIFHGLAWFLFPLPSALVSLFGPVWLVADGVIFEIATRIGLVLSVPGMVALGYSAHLRSGGKYDPQHYRTILRMFFIVLSISLVADIAHWYFLWEFSILYDGSSISNNEPFKLIMLFGYTQKVTVLPVIWALFVFIPIRNRLRRLAIGNLCPICKYDLRGDLEGGCPECGWGREVSGVEDQHETARSTGSDE